MSIKRSLLIVLTASIAFVGCSSDKDNFRTNTVPVQVTAGQQDISKALIRSSEILATGMPNESNEGTLNYQSFYTQDNGTAIVSVLPGKLQLFELVTLPANADINQAASKSRCQWVEGCSSKEFGADISPVYQWQSVVWDLRKDERVVVTPLTHLAAALAFEYAYAETPEPEPVQPGVPIDPLWQKTGYYSPYSVEQAISQVSKLFGLRNVQNSFPADLTRINSLNINNDPESAKNSIRYGAILAAWAHLQENDSEFTQKATAEFVTQPKQGQLLEKEQQGEAVLTQYKIYDLAGKNLKQLPVHNAKIKTLVEEVIAQFETDISKLEDGVLTQQEPDSIKIIFGDTAFNDYSFGVSQAKAFIEKLRDQSKYFFGDTYDGLINTYLEEQKEFFKSNKDNFNEVLKSLKSAESIYIDSYRGSACLSSSSWDDSLWSDCNYSGNVLTLTDKKGKKITLKMKNVTSNKQAVDIEMTGELKINNLLFKLNDSATSKSRVRLFYSEETSQVLASTEPIGYEYNWASFSFYDTVNNDQEWTGNFSLLYRGVVDPEGSTEIRFNIDTLRLSSRISDHIGGTDKDDKEASSVFIAAQSSTADTYYNPNPAEKFGKINGFFTEQSVNVDPDIPGLVSYKLGEELIHNQTVKYFDFYIDDESAQSFRYRFYPDVVRNQNAAGQYTVGNNDAITTHKMAVWPLSKKGGGWGVDGACSPAQVFNGKRDVQKSINALWQAGAFSYVDLPGNGEYFVEWPATKKNGCFELDKLSETAQTITEPAKLVSAAVLRLDTLRVTTEVMLEKQPRTLLDVLISALK